MEWQLAARPPFSLSAVIQSHGWVELAPLAVDRHGGLTWVDHLPSGRVAALSVRQAPGGVWVAAEEALGEGDRREVSERVTWMLLGRYDFVPVDSWALKMVSHERHDGQPAGEAEVLAAFERWGEGKGLAHWFWDWMPR